MIAPGVDTLCYVIRRGVVVIPGDVVTFVDAPDEAWLVAGVKRGIAFLERLRTPTDAEVHAWIAS